MTLMEEDKVNGNRLELAEEQKDIHHLKEVIKNVKDRVRILEEQVSLILEKTQRD